MDWEPIPDRHTHRHTQRHTYRQTEHYNSILSLLPTLGTLMIEKGQECAGKNYEYKGVAPPWRPVRQCANQLIFSCMGQMNSERHVVMAKESADAIVTIIIHFNLSLADMLYRGHLSIADTILKNLIHTHSLIEKPRYSAQK